MNDMQLKSLLLKEQFHVSDMTSLEKASKAFALLLLKNKIIGSHHKDLTASDADISNYAEDIAEVVRNEVLQWMDTANRRSGR